MLASQRKPHLIEYSQDTNLLVQLKQKKKQMMDLEQSIQSKIKQYFSDLTIQICNKENTVLEGFKNKLYEFFNTIDGYCAMSQPQRIYNKEEIMKVLNFELDVIENKRFKEMLNSNIIDICCEDSFDMNATIMSSQHEKTYKKGYDNSHQILKAAYENEIIELEEKIEKLMLKEEKLKSRLVDMDSKHKMKKLGNAYLPYQEKTVSSLLLQRLQSQNKILIEQIADCSQKILSLRSQNSILLREKENSQILPTEKKKTWDELNAIEESIQFTRYQQKISVLEMEIQTLRSQLSKQKQNLTLRQEELLKQNSILLEEQRQKIQQLTDYSQRLYKQCDGNISKKVQLQQKLQEQLIKNEHIVKQIQKIKQMNESYVKLIKLKQDKAIELDIEVKKLNVKMKQSEDNYKKMYVESTQNIQSKQMAIKAKQLEIDSLKTALKKSEGLAAQLKQSLAKKEQEIFSELEKNKSIQAQLIKGNKQKQSYAKKEVNKAKKEIKKQHEEQKKALQQDFNNKYGILLEKIDILKKQAYDNRQKIERKLKIEENRMQLLKERVIYETKEMLEKVSKPNQKDKLLEIVQSYIENEANLSLKNTQIRLLKEEVASFKKQSTKKQKQSPKNITDVQVNAEIQQFQKILYQQKLQLQESIHQSKLKQQQDQYEQIIQQKIAALQSMIAKCQNYEKTAKDFKNQLNNISSQPNPQLNQLKKTNEQMMEKEKKMESLVNSLRNNLNKVQSDVQQAKDQLKVKNDLINGLKKDLKDKELQKQKLNETVNSLIEDMQRLKKTTKQANKKQAIFQQFKQKLVNQNELSEQICNLKANLQQKQKNHRIELNKRDQTIKQLKINQEMLNKKLKGMNSLEEQLLDLRQKMKKMKIEIERKDTLIQHLKQKQEKATNENANAIQTTENQLKKIRKQLETEKTKFDNLKLKHRKLQTNYQLVKIALIKVYEKICTKSNTYTMEYNTIKSDNKKMRYEFTVEKTPQINDMSKYKQGLSILEISSQDLLELANTKSLEPYSPIPHKAYQSNNSQDISKLTELLECPEIDSGPILALFNLVLDQ